MGLIIGMLIRLIAGHYIESRRERRDREELMQEYSAQDMRDRLARIASGEDMSPQAIRERIRRKLESMKEGSTQDIQNQPPKHFLSSGDGHFRLIYDRLSEGSIPPYALYLRPFALDKKIHHRQKISFDFMLQQYLAESGLTLISIGETSGPIGAGHVITTDSRWRDQFRRLAERARTIVVVPGCSKGIISEIRWLIATGLLVNSVFFKPEGYPKDEWEKMQELYEKEEDIELPDYSRRQISFRMYSSGKCYDVATWRTVFWGSKKDLGSAQMQATLLGRLGSREDVR